MPEYRFIGRDQTGASIAKTFKANSVEEVLVYLGKHNIIPIHIEVLKPKRTDYFDTFIHNIGVISVPTEEIMSFCRQLATLLQAGVPIIKSLNQLAQSSKTKFFAESLNAISDEVAAGQSFSNALRKYPSIFSKIVVSIIEVGENTGHLNEALLQISSYLEKFIANRRRFVSTARYPMIVIGAALISMIIMNIFVIPKFASLFAHFGSGLPLPTRIIVAISNFMVNHWEILLAVGIALFFVLPRVINRVPLLHYHWDKFKLKIPIIGYIQMRILVSQFCWTFSLILRSGVSVLNGILLAGQSTGNEFFVKQINIMKDSIEKGQTFSVAATNSQLFFPTIIQMMEVGEESGHMDDILGEVARFYEGEIDYDIRRLNELLEPILLGIVGSIILVMALGIYFPLWDLIKIAKF